MLLFLYHDRKLDPGAKTCLCVAGFKVCEIQQLGIISLKRAAETLMMTGRFPKDSKVNEMKRFAEGEIMTLGKFLKK